jgi:protein-S-isoprenylcysteine O-methyltransferase Ste14
VRNPVRLKNLAIRFLPFYALGGVLLFTVRPGWSEYAAGLSALAAGASLRSWAAGHLVKSDHLTVTGPYARLRHPLYLGTLLAGVGVSLMLGGLAAAALLVAFVPWFFLSYFPRKERSESERLEAVYGEVFARYRTEVPALFPRRSPWKAPAALAFGGERWSLDRYSENNELGTLLGLAACALAFGVRTAIVQSGA